MATTSTTELKLSPADRERIEALARKSDREPDVVLHEAIDAYVGYQEELRTAIEQGLADLDAGKSMSKEEVLDFLAQRRAQRK